MWDLLAVSSWQEEHTAAVGVMFTSSSGEDLSLPVLIVVGRASALGSAFVGGMAPGGSIWHPKQFLRFKFLFRVEAAAPVGIRTSLKSFTLPPKP